MCSNPWFLWKNLIISCIREYFTEHQDEFLRENVTRILEFTWMDSLEIYGILVLIKFAYNLKYWLILIICQFRSENFECIFYEGWFLLGRNSYMGKFKWCLAKRPAISRDVTEWSEEETDMMKNTIQNSKFHSVN